MWGSLKRLDCETLHTYNNSIFKLRMITIPMIPITVKLWFHELYHPTWSDDSFYSIKKVKKLAMHQPNTIYYLYLECTSQTLNNDAHTQEKCIYYQTSKQTSSYFIQIIEGKQKMIFFVLFAMSYVFHLSHSSSV